MGSDFIMEDKTKTLFQVKMTSFSLPPTWRKSGTRNYTPRCSILASQDFPQRSILASRDFPPCCGRNSHHSEVKECQTIFTSLMKPIKSEQLMKEQEDMRRNCVMPSQTLNLSMKQIKSEQIKGEQQDTRKICVIPSQILTTPMKQIKKEQLTREHQDTREKFVTPLRIIASSINQIKNEQIMGQQQDTREDYVTLSQRVTSSIKRLKSELLTREQQDMRKNCVAPSQEKILHQSSHRYEIVIREKNENVGGSMVKMVNKDDKCCKRKFSDTSSIVDHSRETKVLHVANMSKYFDKSISPFRPQSSGRSDDDEEIIARRRVEEILNLFRATCWKVIQEEENVRRVDLEAAKILKKNKKFVNTGRQFGHMQGVNVGDKFRYRIELAIVGLHRPPQSGIDYMKIGDQSLATSIVASGGYQNHMESNELIYMGQGGNLSRKSKPLEDQKLERGNLALKNSIDAKNPIRVIRTPNSHTVRNNIMDENFIYDGLYLVRDYWQEIGSHGKRVYKFRLERIANQLEISWKNLKLR